jgi:hypothetical protein
MENSSLESNSHFGLISLNWEEFLYWKIRWSSDRLNWEREHCQWIWELWRGGCVRLEREREWQKHFWSLDGWQLQKDGKVNLNPVCELKKLQMW